MQLESLRHGLEGNTKMKYQERGWGWGVDWIDVAQN
jgi:hypothetical protein